MDGKAPGRVAASSHQAYARGLCGSLILAAFFWVAALLWLLSFPPPTHPLLGLLVIAACAYVAALMATFLFLTAVPGRDVPQPLVILGRGSVAFVGWVAVGWGLSRLFLH